MTKLKETLEIGNTGISLEKIANNCVYSTEEKVVGKWIDGKLIYRKLLIGSAIGSNSSIQIPTGVSNIKSILNTSGWGLSGTNWFPLSRAHSSTFNYQITFYYYGAGNRFEVETGSSLSLSSIYIVMEYTKTTD